MSEICVIAELNAKEGKRDELISLFKPLVEETRKEPGNVYYDCCESSPGKFVFVEKYKSEADLDIHMKNDHFTKAFPLVQQLIEGEVKITRLPKLF